MRAHYDFAGMKSRGNPYARRLKRSVTMRLDEDSIAYFKELAAETGVPYQSLINLYLRDCVVHRRRLAQSWESGGGDQPDNDPRFPNRVAQARAGLRAGHGVPWREADADEEAATAGVRASDKPRVRGRRPETVK